MLDEQTEITYGFLTEATPEAAAELNGLMGQLTAGSNEVTQQRLREILGAGTKIVVARDAGHIVGTASVVLSRQLTSTKAWVEDVVVDEGHRGQGIARRLMLAAVDYARDQGCKNLNLTSAPQRQAAWKLYESLGFQRRETSVYRLHL